MFLLDFHAQDPTDGGQMRAACRMNTAARRIIIETSLQGSSQSISRRIIEAALCWKDYI